MSIREDMFPKMPKMSNPEPSKEADEHASRVVFFPSRGSETPQRLATYESERARVARLFDQHTATLHSRAEQAEARVAELEAENAELLVDVAEARRRLDVHDLRFAKADELAQALEQWDEEWPEDAVNGHVRLALAAYRDGNHSNISKSSRKESA